MDRQMVPAVQVNSLASLPGAGAGAGTGTATVGIASCSALMMHC